MFVAIGEGSTRRATMQSVSECHRDKILFLGEQADVESIVNLFDVGVLATFTEGISNSVMEYMVLGKPVIATDGGGTRELVADHEVGFLVGPKRPHELADRVIHLLDHPELRERMGAAGRERIRRLFSLEAMTAAHARLYRRLAANAWRGLALSEPGA
jgi:glycosyltransferase involved in cell wall biosynthesis